MKVMTCKLNSLSPSPQQHLPLSSLSLRFSVLTTMADSPRTSPTLTTVKHHTSPSNTDTKTTTFFNTRKTMSFAYCFTFIFIVCASFSFLNPSGSSSPWLNNIFKFSSNTSTTSSYRSHFSSLFSHFLPNSSSFSHQPNTSLQLSNYKDINQSVSNDKMGISQSSKSQPFSAPTVSLSQESRNSSLNGKVEGSKESNKTPLLNGSSNINVTNHPVSSQSFLNDSREGNPVKKQFSLKRENVTRNESREGFLVKEMSECNIYDGRWVRDDSYPLYAAGSCPHIDEPFNCFVNGRPENGYEKYRWQPMDCNIPRLNGKDMLELLRGKRLVFVGDSLNRNMWESLVCVLRNSVEDKRRVFEASGRREFRTEGSYSFIFKDYNCSVEFFRSPFLVQEWEIPDTNGSKKETLRLDVIERSSDKYKSADVLIFNTGHWWTHEKTSRGKGYYQEGSHIYGELNVKEAFRKALTTWARWVDANINPMKTLVFFRGYSASHFRGGRWNSGGQCDNETDPIKNVTYLAKYPPKMRTLESVMKGMKTPVFYLNLTRLTDFRKDAHPSIYRKQNLTDEERKSPLRFQDCSHWCLPGVPDTWNELVYAQLLIKYNQKQ